MRNGFVAVGTVLALVLPGTSLTQAADVPLPVGAEVTATKDLADGGTKQSLQTEQSAADLIASYSKTLEAAGWTISRHGSGGGPSGGGAELNANRGEKHLVLQAGGPKGRTFAGLCFWPKRPPNDYCG